MNVKKANFWLYIVLGYLISSVAFPSLSVQADSVRSVETNGTVSFYGKYIPIGAPNPEPPGVPDLDTGNPVVSEEDNPASTGRPGSGQKPGGFFPQTGELFQTYSLWIGLFLVGIVLSKWKKERLRHLFY